METIFVNKQQNNMPVTGNGSYHLTREEEATDLDMEWWLMEDESLGNKQIDK